MHNVRKSNRCYKYFKRRHETSTLSSNNHLEMKMNKKSYIHKYKIEEDKFNKKSIGLTEETTRTS